MTSEITVRGGKDCGDVRQVNGKWYIRTDSFHVNATEMEDAYDVTMEAGWYSNLRLAETADDLALVNIWKQNQEQKAQAGIDKLYAEQNTSGFIPYVGQRVSYRFTGKPGTITDIKKSVDTVYKQIYGRNEPVKQPRWQVALNIGKKVPVWVTPYLLKPEDESENVEVFVDLNEVFA